MIQNPILKVLSTLSTHEVRLLLMGGQACVLYGGAQFSRDCDIVVLASLENLDRLSNALHELQAERIAVPPFEVEFLEKSNPTPEQVSFWLREARTPEMLIRLAAEYREACSELRDERPLLVYAEAGDIQQLAAELTKERERERELDRRHWEPLLQELEHLRQARR